MNWQAEKEDKSLCNQQKTIIEHMGLICCIAQRMKDSIPKEMPWEDVLQYGCIGLVEAMKRYDAGKGNFSTFAGIHIYGSIVDGVFQFLGVKRLRKGGKLSLKRLQMEDPVVIQSMGEYRRRSQADDWIERIEEKISLDKALLSLEPKERELIEAIYFQRKNWAEYAQEKFVDTEWVYLMHRRILKKLRKWLKS